MAKVLQTVFKTDGTVVLSQGKRSVVLTRQQALALAKSIVMKLLM